MRQNILYAIILLCTLLLGSCTESGTVQSVDNIMEYANYINTIPAEHGYEVQISNPWRANRLLSSYTLSDSLPTCYTYGSVNNTIHVPLNRVVLMTNSLAHLMAEIGLVNKIAGVCEPEYVWDSTVNASILQGNIANCGNSMYPLIEKIIELNPDAILVSPFEESGYGQLERLGIPLIECADYMESSPLGRAEWMRFYGRLFGKGECADSLFCSVQAKYHELCDTALVLAGISRPKVMLDTKSGSAWYTAGGGSTIGEMIHDAGGQYAFAHIEKSGSVPLSFETVFDKAADSNIWLLKNSNSRHLTYSLLEESFKAYARFKPFVERNIWVCNVYEVPYFENTAFHPELLLEEMISIFHPGYYCEHQFYTPLLP